MLLQVITGTTREGRFSERVAHWMRYAVHVQPDVMIQAMQLEDRADTSPFAPLEPKLTLLIDDLVWWTAALSAAREADA